jgi:hypothetical protein
MQSLLALKAAEPMQSDCNYAQVLLEFWHAAA